MAQPIPLELPPRDPRAELQVRLQNAPLEHAEALLAAYQVLQGMHDRGVFDLMRGALGSSDHPLETFVQAAKSPESIRSIRNFGPKPPGFWSILKRFRNPEFRRGLILVNSLLEAFGRNLPPEKNPNSPENVAHK